MNLGVTFDIIPSVFYGLVIVRRTIAVIRYGKHVFLSGLLLLRLESRLAPSDVKDNGKSKTTVLNALTKRQITISSCAKER